MISVVPSSLLLEFTIEGWLYASAPIKVEWNITVVQAENTIMNTTQADKLPKWYFAFFLGVSLESFGDDNFFTKSYLEFGGA